MERVDQKKLQRPSQRRRAIKLHVQPVKSHLPDLNRTFPSTSVAYSVPPRPSSRRESWSNPLQALSQQEPIIMMPEAQIAQSHSTLEETPETPNKIQGYKAWDMWDTDYMLGDAEEGWDIEAMPTAELGPSVTEGASHACRIAAAGCMVFLYDRARSHRPPCYRHGSCSATQKAGGCKGKNRGSQCPLRTPGASA